LKGDKMKARKYWILAAMLAICASIIFAANKTNPLTSQQVTYPAEQGDTLRGLEGMGVIVSLNPKAELYGSTVEKLQTDIESHLRRYGIKVLAAQEISKTLGMPYLAIYVNCQISDDDRLNGICGGSLQIYFVQNIFLQRNPELLCRAATWIDFVTFTVERDNLEKTVQEGIREKVDKFCSEYLAANPKEDAKALKDEQLITGTVRYIKVEGGFYGLVGDNGEHYDPVNLPKEYAKDGLRVKFQVKAMEGMVGIHMWGKIVEIVKIERL